MTHVRINQHLIRCAVARTPSELTLGLQRHAALSEDEGMLFLFPQPRMATFHMGEVAFPIDILGIDENSRVTRIVEGARPGSLERWYFPRVVAVLEVAGGTCRRLPVKVGDTCAILSHEREAQYAPIVYHGSQTSGLTELAAYAPSYEGGIGTGVYVAFDPEVANYYGDVVYKLELLAPEDSILWLTPDTIDTFISAYFQNSILVGESVFPFSFDIHGQRYSVVAGSGGVYNDRDFIEDLKFSLLLEMLETEHYPEAEWLRALLRNSRNQEVDTNYVQESFFDFLAETKGIEDEEVLRNFWDPFFLWLDPLISKANKQALDMLGLCISLDEVGGEARHAGYRGVYLSGVRGRSGPNEELLIFDPEDLQMLGELRSSSSVNEEERHASLLELEDLDEPIEDHEPHKNTEPGGKVYDEPKARYFRDLWGDLLANEALDVRPGLQTRSGASRRHAQIVDEAKFVEKVAPILFSHASEIPWEKDVLNGGATERAVVTRADLARWLSGTTSQAPGTDGADPQSMKYILSVAGNEQGLRLLGSAFILAEMADFTRLGWAQKHPVLVLYRASS